MRGMPQNWFEQLCGQLHFNDDSLALTHRIPGYDKLYKIRPVINLICDKSRTLYILGEKVLVDETMMKFKGRSSMKQYEPLKPIKMGFKIWCRAHCTNGYVYVLYVKVDGPATNLDHKVVMEICKDTLGLGHRKSILTIFQVFIWLWTYWNMGPLV